MAAETIGFSPSGFSPHILKGYIGGALGLPYEMANGLLLFRWPFFCYNLLQFLLIKCLTYIAIML